jgi:hypothetical protein
VRGAAGRRIVHRFVSPSLGGTTVAGDGAAQFTES